MPNLGSITKSLRSIFGLNSDLKSNLLELKKDRNENKIKRFAENLIAVKGNTTIVAPNKVNKKTNKSIFGLKKEDITKDLSELKNTFKNSKSKTIKNKVKNSEIKAKKYYGYDDIEYKATTDIKSLYDDIDDDDYYKPIKIYNAFNDSYVEYQSDGYKDKILSIKEYLYMIRQYPSDTINCHKDEWKIQLSMRINFSPSENTEDSEDSEDFNETRSLYTNSDNIVIMIGYETDAIRRKD